MLECTRLMMGTQRQETEEKGLWAKGGPCRGVKTALGSKSQTLCRLLFPVKTQILTKASLFGGFLLRKFRVKIAQKGLESS